MGIGWACRAQSSCTGESLAGILARGGGPGGGRGQGGVGDTSWAVRGIPARLSPSLPFPTSDAGALCGQWQRAGAQQPRSPCPGGASEFRPENPDSWLSAHMPAGCATWGRSPGLSPLPHCGATWGLGFCKVDEGGWGRGWLGSGVLVCEVWVSYWDRQFWPIPWAPRNFWAWCSGSRVPVGCLKKIFSAFILLYLIFLNVTQISLFLGGGGLVQVHLPCQTFPPECQGVND